MMVSAELKALRVAREKLGIDREVLAKALGVTYKTIEKIENGRLALSSERREQILKFLGIDEHRLKRIQKAGVVVPKERKKLVLENSQRRSYRKVVTKEVKVLRSLRRMRGFSQDQASKICGYSRPTIGHIENGRIEIPISRIRHIVSSYNFSFSKFEELMKEEFLRDEIIEKCTEKLINLSEDKLKLASTLIQNL
jgi:transcriptional regulator with XRE-family HTH domain